MVKPGPERPDVRRPEMRERILFGAAAHAREKGIAESDSTSRLMAQCPQLPSQPAGSRQCLEEAIIRTRSTVPRDRAEWTLASSDDFIAPICPRRDLLVPDLRSTALHRERMIVRFSSGIGSEISPRSKRRSCNPRTVSQHAHANPDLRLGILLP